MNNAQLHNSSQHINIGNQTMAYSWKTARSTAQKTIWAKEDEAEAAWNAFIGCYGHLDKYFHNNPTYTWAGHYCLDDTTAQETLRHWFFIYATDTMSAVETVLHNTKNIQLKYNFEWLCLPYLFFQAEGNKDVRNRPANERQTAVPDDIKKDWMKATMAADMLSQVEWTERPDENRGQPGDLPAEWYNPASPYYWITSGRRTKERRFTKTSVMITRKDLILPEGMINPFAQNKLPAAAGAVVATGAKNPTHHTVIIPENTRITRSSGGDGGGGGGRGGGGLTDGKASGGGGGGGGKGGGGGGGGGGGKSGGRGGGGGGLTHGKKNVYQLPGNHPRPTKGSSTHFTRKVLKGGVSKRSIRRMAYRGGIRRISAVMYEETRGILKKFVETIVRDSVAYTEYTKRTTVTVLDVLYALRKRNKHLYGYGY